MPKVEVDEDFLQELMNQIVYYENKIFMMNQTISLLSTILTWVYMCCSFIYSFKSVFNPVPLSPEVNALFTRLLEMPGEMYTYFTSSFVSFQSSFASEMNLRFNRDYFKSDIVFVNDLNKIFDYSKFSPIIHKSKSLHNLLLDMKTKSDDLPNYVELNHIFTSPSFSQHLDELFALYNIKDKYSSKMLIYYLQNSTLLEYMTEKLFKSAPYLSATYKIAEIEPDRPLLEWYSKFLYYASNVTIGNIKFSILEWDKIKSFFIDMNKKERDIMLSLSLNLMKNIKETQQVNTKPAYLYLDGNQEYMRIKKGMYEILKKIENTEVKTITPTPMLTHVMSNFIMTKITNRNAMEAQVIMLLNEELEILYELLANIALRFTYNKIQLPNNLIDPIKYLIDKLFFTRNAINSHLISE